MKITNELKRDIIDQYNAGYSYKQIGITWGVSTSTVFKIIENAKENDLISRKTYSQPLSKKYQPKIPKQRQVKTRYDVDFKSDKSRNEYEQVKQLSKQGLTSIEIAEKMNITKSLVRYYVSIGYFRQELEPKGRGNGKRKPTINDLKKDEIIKLWESGVTNYTDIANEIGCSQTTIGVIIRKCIANGEIKPLREKKEYDHKDIVEMYNNGYTHQEIADKYNSRPTIINTILKRESDNGVEVHYRNKHISAEKKAEIMKLLMSGVSIAQTAKKTGVTYQTVKNINDK